MRWTCSRRTLCRTFSRELAVARRKKMLENVRRLYAAAKKGQRLRDEVGQRLRSTLIALPPF
jgi:hypothetical protein